MVTTITPKIIGQWLSTAGTGRVLKLGRVNGQLLVSTIVVCNTTNGTVNYALSVSPTIFTADTIDIAGEFPVTGVPLGPYETEVFKGAWTIEGDGQIIAWSAFSGVAFNLFGQELVTV